MRLAILALITCIAAIAYGTGNQATRYSMDWYDDAWAKVDSLDNEGLPKSALEIVDEIYGRAKSESNDPHLIKSLLFRSRYQMTIEEDVVDKVFGDLNEELQNLSGPSKAVLHSIVGELYWQYFQQNRYQYYDRTTGGAPDDASIETWDLRKIVATALQHYRASLQDPSGLSSVVVDRFAPIVMIQAGARADRPTLYDFLAHRALDVLENGESALTSPVNAFRIDVERDLAPLAAFMNGSIETSDSLSMQAEVLHIYQTLLKLHADDRTPDALVHSDLRRLKYVKSQVTADRVRDKYLAALDELATRVEEFPAYAEVRHAYAAELEQRANGYLPPSNEFKWDRKRAVEICESAMRTFPASRGARYCQSLVVSAGEKQLNAEMQGVVMPDEEAFARVTYKNLSVAYVKIVKLSRQELRNWRSAGRQEQDASVARWIEADEVYEANLTLPDDGDLQQHSTLLAMPALSSGAYGVLVGSSSAFSTTGQVLFSGTLIASDLSYIMRREPNGDNRMYVVGRLSGHPIAGANVVGYLNSRNGIPSQIAGSGKATDATGMLILDGAYERIDNFEITKGNDWLFSESGIYRNRPYEQTRESMDTRFFTDRSIYRPGQRVHFKGILLKRVDDRYEIRPNSKTTVRFRDVNGREIESLDLTANEYGTVAGEFIAPRGVLTGNMSIEDGNGSVSFSVEEYKRPRFEVTLEPVTEAVSLGDSITVHGRATSLAGAAIGDATINFRVRRSTYFPWWGYRFWRPSPRTTDSEIAYGTAKTNPDGTFEISFLAQEDDSVTPTSRPTYNFTVSADVTDIAGETRSISTTVNASRESTFLALQVADQLDADKSIDITVGANNINGQPLQFSGEVTVTKLEKPGLLLPSKFGRVDTLEMSRDDFKRITPHEAYLEEQDPPTWARGKVELSRKVSGAGSETISTGGRVKWEPGSYEVRFTTTNREGAPVEATRYTTVFASRDDDAPARTLDWFTLLTPTVEPGGRARYLVGSSEKDLRVLVEIEREGEIIESEWVRISREQKELSFPILEEHRGNLGLHVTFAWGNYVFSKSNVINVPWTNKQLSMTWETFRSKLYPGQEETWKLKIQGPKGEAVASEMVATLYDASLDALRSHNWNLDLWPTYGASLYWNTSEFSRAVPFRRDGRDWNRSYGPGSPVYDQMNLFGLNWYNNAYYRFDSPRMYKSASVTVQSGLVSEGMADMQARGAAAPEAEDALEEQAAGALPTGDAPATVRKNLNETAFFFPQLQTDAEGATILSFTMPEALTRWRFMGLSISKDLKIGAATNETVTQKELMVTPNAPRFFRDGDRIVFTAKVDNLTEVDLTGTADIVFEDATTGGNITQILGVTAGEQPITIKAGQSTPLEWSLSIPGNIDAITYRVSARTDQFADGEESIVPVLTNRMLVTESLPLPMRGPGTKKFRFDKLADHTSSTLVNERFTLEYSPNPIWYAVQALPYLMEFPHECAEQVFSRFYANGVATYIVDRQPRLRTVYDEWKSADASALVSNLEKNQELKAVLLEEAPWVMQAANESERKRRIGILFDTFRMRGELAGAISKLEQMQRPSGAWPWFEGMVDNRYITQHIVKGIGYLRHIGVLETIDDGRPAEQARRAISYLDEELVRDYERLVESGVNLETQRTSMLQLHHLYSRSFFPEVEMDEEYKKVQDYFVNQAREFWLSYSYLGQGMIALEAKRAGQESVAEKIVKSLRENSIDNEELGMYWKLNVGYFWFEAPIETQALLIEVFNEVADDKESVAAMQLWLLKQKQTQDWKTTKATTDAIYALLMRGTNLLEVVGTVSISLGDQIVSSANSETEAGTGYIKKAWNAEDVSSSLADITVTKSGDGPAWGAAYWQYFEDLDQITPAETPLRLEKELFVQRQTDAGSTLSRIDPDTKLTPGDLVKVRVIVKVDRAMEYIHLKDMRSSGFEPVNVLSGYRWQDGLGYYESTRDAATHFFISYLPKGTFVFEYPVRVSHRGDFSNGITTIQSMYAPEFTSHSAGIRVTVGS